MSYVPSCYRCNSLMENIIEKQWFLDIKIMMEKVELNTGPGLFFICFGRNK